MILEPPFWRQFPTYLHRANPLFVNQQCELEKTTQKVGHRGGNTGPGVDSQQVSSRLSRFLRCFFKFSHTLPTSPIWHLNQQLFPFPFICLGCIAWHQVQSWEWKNQSSLWGRGTLNGTPAQRRAKRRTSRLKHCRAMYEESLVIL